MSYQIETTPTFDRSVKRLLKKYRHLKGDLLVLAAMLAENPFAGVAIPGYSHAIWKIRLASSDMQSGKRGGYRVIYAVDAAGQRCILLFLYAKNEQKMVPRPRSRSSCPNLNCDRPTRLREQRLIRADSPCG